MPISRYRKRLYGAFNIMAGLNGSGFEVEDEEDKKKRVKAEYEEAKSKGKLNG